VRTSLRTSIKEEWGLTSAPILLQKEELGFEHQAAIMPAVPPPEQARILHFLLMPMGKKVL
jgi:acyl-CoA thioesterase